MYQVKNERKLRKLGIESCMRANDKGGRWERIAVSPIKRVRNSSLQIQLQKFSIKISFTFTQIAYTP